MSSSERRVAPRGRAAHWELTMLILNGGSGERASRVVPFSRASSSASESHVVVGSDSSERSRADCCARAMVALANVTNSASFMVKNECGGRG